jgi:hypothetical protein
MADKKLPPLKYERLDRRGNLTWLALCASAGLIVVLGALGWELAAELFGAGLLLSVGSITLTHKRMFDRFYAAAAAHWPSRDDARYQDRLDKLEQTRRFLRDFVPPFAILIGLGFLAGAIESIIR